MNSAHELSTLIAALRELQREPHPRAALTTLVRTRGSTFRRAGTRMLVLADGRVVCELSGGCPQRDIIHRALEAIDRGEPRLVSYNAESALDVLMEMGCGGELDVLLEPLATGSSMAFVDILADCLEKRRSVRMATVYAIGGAVLMPRRLLWRDDDVLHDSLDDAGLTHSIMAAVTAHSGASTLSLSLPTAHGEAQVLMESIHPPHALAVIGSSAAARALLPLAGALGWRITLVDHDPARLLAADLPAGLHTVCAGPEAIRAALPLDRQSSVMVMTHNLERDVAYLTALHGAPIAYLGSLGSRERAERMRREAELGGMALHAPAGLDIGSETPEEIALAVAAEIMAVINGRSGGPLRENQGAIHG